MNFLKKLSTWYFSKNALPYWSILCIDCAILLFFYFFGYYCVLGGTGVVDHFWDKLGILCLCMPFYLVAFKVFHTYANVIRYSSFSDLTNVLLAVASGSAVVLGIRLAFFATTDDLFPGLRVILFATCFSTLAMCALRVTIKVFYEISNLNSKAENAFIYGTKEGGAAIAKHIRTQANKKFVLKGFVSPDKNLQQRFMMSLPIYADDLKLVPMMMDMNIHAIIVSPLMMEHFRNEDRLVNDLAESGIKIYVMPDVLEWNGETNTNANSLRSVDIEELLPRNQIEVNMEAIGNLIRGKKVLVTGAAGSIGSEMVKQIASFAPEEMMLIDQAETPMHNVRLTMANEYASVPCQTIVTSITNKVRMEAIFSQLRPDYVFHAAAYKHVPMMEDNPQEAILNNIIGTRVIADLAVKYGTRKFVMISTDKAVNPTNVMGCSKRICEIYCQSLNEEIHKEGSNILQADGQKAITQFVTTRFGNVLGSNGSVIPIFKEQIRKGGPVTVTHPDIIRYFMLIPEACKLVLEAGTFGHGGEIFIFDMGKAVKIADLAKRMIALSNAQGVKIEYTGLRDGEKLFEEVLSDAEKTIPTDHPKIRVAQVRKYDYLTALKYTDELYELSLSATDMDIVKKMKEIVPEYKSRHSKYEVLD